MATTEHTINDALADALRQTRRIWQSPGVVRSETTGTLKTGRKQPDILIVEPNTSPVIIETEVLPAATVEADAVARLGEQLTGTGRTILSSIAIRLPLALRQHQGASALQAALRAQGSLEMALFTGSNAATAARLPSSGWMRGEVADLSILVQYAGVPPDVIDAAASVLVEGVSDAAGLLGEVAQTHSGAIHKISDELRQGDSEQTRRMAMTIVANAFVFHENLAGGPGNLEGVRSLEELRGGKGLNKAAVLAEWRKILNVNYWPIFDIARRILEIIPTTQSRAIIERLAETASRLVENRLTRSHDLTGAVFQRLIADRKFLAAFYTTPAAAALVAGLAISPEKSPSGCDWFNATDLKQIRVADFACGTGTLLSMAYQRIGQLHELAGGDAESLHPAMMADGLVGCDVLPAAAHLTASMLAGAHPTTKYDRSSVLTVAYGKQNGYIALGSLDLLDPQGRLGFYAITAQAAHGLGESEKNIWMSLPHASFDMIIMNPPFTRPTGQEGGRVGVSNPMFAAFGISKDDLRLMTKAYDRLAKGTSYNGNAGEASIFLVLVNRKLKPCGMLALVMPLSLMAGDAWEDSRSLLTSEYADLVIVTIAGAGDSDASFSADTRIGECVVIGRKTGEYAPGGRRATFVSLYERPSYPLIGSQVAREIRCLVDARQLHRLEDGPVGATPIRFGDRAVGEVLDAPLPTQGGWLLSRIKDFSVAQTAYQVATSGRVWLPTMSEREVLVIPMTTVEEIGEVGPYHADIQWATQSGGIRGPFRIDKARSGSVPTYPVLWSCDADRERTMNFEADSEGVQLKGKDRKEQTAVVEKVKAVWASASHCHLNRDFRFNSHSIAMQYTTRRTIGGRAWPSISLGTSDLEKALVVWGNTTIGLLVYWWRANKSLAGRGTIGVKGAKVLPILDVTKLSARQLASAVAIFDLMCRKELLPLNEIDRDPARRELDTAFARDVLGFEESVAAPGGPLDTLRMKLAREPSVHGGKTSRVGV